MSTKLLNESFSRLFEGIGDDDFKSVRLDEKIPKDLAKSYKRAGNSPFDSYDSMSSGKQPDFEAAEYTEITPEEALAYKKSGDVSNLRIMVDGSLVRFYPDGSVANRTELGWGARDKIYTNRNGKRVSDTKYMPFSHIVKIADKIYYTNEGDTKISPEKMARRDDRDLRYANLKLGAERKGWGSPSSAKKDIRDYEKYLAKSQDALRKLEAEWEAGNISRNEYEKRKASIEDSIGYDKRSLYRAIGQRADRRAEARNFVGNREAQSAVNKFRDLKNSLSFAKSSAKRAEEKLSTMKDGRADSATYKYDREQLARYKKQLADAQYWIKHYESKLSDDSVGADIAKQEAELDSKLAEVQSISDQISAMLSKNKPMGEAVDLSTKDGSMTKVLQNNMKMVNKAKSPAQLADIVENIFLEYDIKTKASSRLVNNIRKSKDLVQAQSTLYNSVLAGSGLETVKTKSAKKSIKESALDNPPVKSIKELAARGIDPDGDYMYNVFPKDGTGAIVPEDNYIERVDSKYVYVEGYGVQGNPNFMMTLRIPINQFDKYYNFIAID